MNEIKETQATYNQIAPAYAQSWAQRGRLWDHLERFIKLLPTGLVLDVGCGPGLDTAVLRERGLPAVGCDLSWGMLQAGRRDHAVTAPLVQMDMRQMPFSANKVAGIWSCASLLHLPRDLVPTAFKEFARLLMPGGVLYVSVKEGRGEVWGYKAYEHELPRFFTFWQAGPFDALLAEAGLTIVDGWINEGSPHPWLVRFARKM